MWTTNFWPTNFWPTNFWVTEKPITTLAYGRVTITGSDKLPVEVST